jgi:hypothetical protein
LERRAISFCKAFSFGEASLLTTAAFCGYLLPPSSSHDHILAENVGRENRIWLGLR